MDYNLYFYFFAAVFIINILEMVLVNVWFYSFYAFGIPIFQKRFTYVHYLDKQDLILKISDPGEGGGSPVFKFHTFDNDKIGFKEKQNWSFFKRKEKQYTPLMRGIIDYDVITKTVTVKGILNWSNVFMVLLFCFFALMYMQNPGEEPTLFPYLFLIGPFVILAFIYWKQSKVYNEIVDKLKNQLGSLERL